MEYPNDAAEWWWWYNNYGYPPPHMLPPPIPHNNDHHLSMQSLAEIKNSKPIPHNNDYHSMQSLAEIEKNKKKVDVERLTSFLEFNDDFLTPWNWSVNRSDVNNHGGCYDSNGRMQFESGSFFSDAANNAIFRNHGHAVAEEEVKLEEVEERKEESVSSTEDGFVTVRKEEEEEKKKNWSRNIT